jgi:hypothetical protein
VGSLLLARAVEVAIDPTSTAALITGIVALANVPAGAPIWRVILGVATLVSVAGPLVSLALWHDSPDVFLPTTVLELIAPVCALIFSFFVGAKSER